MKIDLRLGDCIEVLKTIPDNSVDSIVTDPPYGIGFMNKEWDNPQKHQELIEREKKRSEERFEEGKSPVKGGFSKGVQPGLPIGGATEGKWFQDWCELWARECYRVLKPGGHVLSFAAPRTYHRMATAFEDSGFQIRDQIMWVFGSGFPKSLNIGKAIDKKQGIISHSILELKQIIIDYFNRKNITKKKFDELCGFRAANYMRTEHREDDGWGEAIPTNEKWIKMKEVLGIDTTEYDELFFSAQREVVGKGSSGIGKAFGKDGWVSETMEFDITEAKNDAAKEWEGWGTALKPAHEPIVMARKPLSEKSIAENVLKHGTGGINIDGSRIEYTDTNRPIPQLEQGKTKVNSTKTMYDGQSFNKSNTEATIGGSLEGRFPANIIFDEEAGKLLDEQSGERGNGWKKNYGKEDYDGLQYSSSTQQCKFGGGYNGKNTYVDSGGASRFFYCPKTSKKDRNEGLDVDKQKNPRPIGVAFNNESDLFQQTTGNNHPTVKPTDLMRYLINLVTPKGGTTLDPFMGSGSTGKAAVQCRVNFIGIEKEEEYMKIAEARINHERNKTKQLNLFDGEN